MQVFDHKECGIESKILKLANSTLEKEILI